MYQITDFTTRCVYDCYVLMKKCVDFEHIEDSEFVLSTFKQIGQYKIALPPELNKHIEQFLEKTLHPIIDDNEFFSAITKPEYGTYNEKGHFEINSERSLELMVCEMLKICIELERKVDSFAEQYLAPYLLT